MSGKKNMCVVTDGCVDVSGHTGDCRIAQVKSYNYYVQRMQILFPTMQFRTWQSLPDGVKQDWSNLYHG